MKRHTERFARGVGCKLKRPSQGAATPSCSPVSAAGGDRRALLRGLTHEAPVIQKRGEAGIGGRSPSTRSTATTRSAVWEVSLELLP